MGALLGAGVGVGAGVGADVGAGMFTYTVDSLISKSGQG